MKRPYYIGMDLIIGGKYQALNVSPQANFKYANGQYSLDLIHPWSIHYHGKHQPHRPTTDEEMMSSLRRWRDIDNYNKFIDDIEVGDFVQFKGQRDTKSWRKIVSIDYDNFKLFGIKYSKPIDEDRYSDNHSSANGLFGIKALHKNK